MIKFTQVELTSSILYSDSCHKKLKASLWLKSTRQNWPFAYCYEGKRFRITRMEIENTLTYLHLIPSIWADWQNMPISQDCYSQEHITLWICFSETILLFDGTKTQWEIVTIIYMGILYLSEILIIAEGFQLTSHYSTYIYVIHLYSSFLKLIRIWHWNVIWDILSQL